MLEANFLVFYHPYLPWGHVRSHTKCWPILTFSGHKQTDNNPDRQAKYINKSYIIVFKCLNHILWCL